MKTQWVWLQLAPERTQAKPLLGRPPTGPLEISACLRAATSPLQNSFTTLGPGWGVCLALPHPGHARGMVLTHPVNLATNLVTGPRVLNSSPHCCSQRHQGPGLAATQVSGKTSIGFNGAESVPPRPAGLFHGSGV